MSGTDVECTGFSRPCMTSAMPRPSAESIPSSSSVIGCGMPGPDVWVAALVGHARMLQHAQPARRQPSTLARLEPADVDKPESREGAFMRAMEDMAGWRGLMVGSYVDNLSTKRGDILPGEQLELRTHLFLASALLVQIVQRSQFIPLRFAYFVSTQALCGARD
eukprot:1169663-Rhodomonas_salina.5